jgi:hypothetical protein
MEFHLPEIGLYQVDSISYEIEEFIGSSSCSTSYLLQCLPFQPHLKLDMNVSSLDCFPHQLLLLPLSLHNLTPHPFSTLSFQFSSSPPLLSSFISISTPTFHHLNPSPSSYPLTSCLKENQTLDFKIGGKVGEEVTSRTKMKIVFEVEGKLEWKKEILIGWLRKEVELNVMSGLIGSFSMESFPQFRMTLTNPDSHFRWFLDGFYIHEKERGEVKKIERYKRMFSLYFFFLFIYFFLS